MRRWIEFCLVVVLGYAVYCIAPSVGRAIDRSHDADEITCGAKLKAADYEFSLGFEAKSTNVKDRPTAGTVDGHDKN